MVFHNNTYIHKLTRAGKRPDGLKPLPPQRKTCGIGLGLLLPRLGLLGPALKFRLVLTIFVDIENVS
jgi:hypothetical protein